MGLLYSAVVSTDHPRRPWIVLAVGAIQCFLGYIFMWAAVSGLILDRRCRQSVHAQVFFNTANVVTGVHNFQLYSGTVVGILKGFLGLSAAVLIQFSNAFFNGDPVNYLLMLAILPALTTLLLMRFAVIDNKTETGNELTHLNSLSTIALTICGYLTILIILDNVLNLPTWVRIFTFILLLAFLVSPVGIAIRAKTEDSVFKTKLQITENPVEYHRIPSEEKINDEMVIVKDGEMNITEAIGTMNFWLLFFAMMCGMGSGLATINNMNQLCQSLGFRTVEINTFVSLWSIWNFLGRLGSGYASDLLLWKLGWARPVLMAIALLTMSIGHIIVALGFRGNLYLGSVIVGICYGPIGSYVLSVRVIGYIYDREASAGDNFCSGGHCFMTSFLIMAAVAFLGFVVVVALFFRTRRFYQLLVQRRLED
ncbi:unnamed protein product [Citrullus colocynthis]|uniref:Nodulin-like domain-containing protein n=1 Tax=Citrullus colocynthis TaxID=252529 RepID=A0ABP0ZHH2_9ROSI